jgi:hypothetical protein
MRASHVWYQPSCAVDISKEVISANKAAKQPTVHIIGHVEDDFKTL